MLDFQEFAQKQIDAMWEAGVPFVWPVLLVEQESTSEFLFYWKVHDCVIRANLFSGYNPCYFNSAETWQPRVDYLASRFRRWPELSSKIGQIQVMSKSVFGYSSRKLSRYTDDLIDEYIKKIPSLHPSEYSRWYLVMQHKSYHAYRTNYDDIMSKLRSVGYLEEGGSVCVLFPRTGEGAQYPHTAKDHIKPDLIPNDEQFIEVLQYYADYSNIRPAFKEIIRRMIYMRT